MRIPLEHVFTLELAKQAHLELTDFQSSDSPFHYFFDNVKFPIPDLDGRKLQPFLDMYGVLKNETIRSARVGIFKTFKCL